MTKQDKKRAVIFVAWGKEHLAEMRECIDKSPELAKYDLHLVTDTETADKQIHESVKGVTRVDFGYLGNKRKAVMFEYRPAGYNSYVFLDTDVFVMEDIGRGFDKAEKHGMAIAIAPIYSIGQDRCPDVIKQEGLPWDRCELYNSGVIFFDSRPEVEAVFEEWKRLASQYPKYKMDQPFLSFAIEKLNFNPYIFGRSWNFRRTEEHISGPVYIWHHPKYYPPKDINGSKTVRWLLRNVDSNALEKRK